MPTALLQMAAEEGVSSTSSPKNSIGSASSGPFTQMATEETVASGEEHTD